MARPYRAQPDKNPEWVSIGRTKLPVRFFLVSGSIFPCGRGGRQQSRAGEMPRDRSPSARGRVSDPSFQRIRRRLLCSPDDRTCKASRDESMYTYTISSNDLNGFGRIAGARRPTSPCQQGHCDHFGMQASAAIISHVVQHAAHGRFCKRSMATNFLRSSHGAGLPCCIPKVFSSRRHCPPMAIERCITTTIRRLLVLVKEDNQAINKQVFS